MVGELLYSVHDEFNIGGCPVLILKFMVSSLTETGPFLTSSGCG